MWLFPEISMELRSLINSSLISFWEEKNRINSMNLFLVSVVSWKWGKQARGIPTSPYFSCKLSNSYNIFDTSVSSFKPLGFFWSSYVTVHESEKIYKFMQLAIQYTNDLQRSFSDASCINKSQWIVHSWSLVAKTSLMAKKEYVFSWIFLD